jgi:glycosidase
MNFTSTHDISRAINIFATNDFNGYSEWAWNLNNNNLEWCKNFKLTLQQYKNGKDILRAYTFALTFLPGILSIFYGDEVGLQGIGNLANRKPFPWDKEDNDLLEHFKYLGDIRNEEKFLEEADLNIVDINSNYLSFRTMAACQEFYDEMTTLFDIPKIELLSKYSPTDLVGNEVAFNEAMEEWKKIYILIGLEVEYYDSLDELDNLYKSKGLKY